MFENNRKNKLIINTVSSLFLQISTIVCGFVLPRLIISAYGSDVNGLVNSINQFLHIITFLELGVGAVVQSALYKPLVEKDNDSINGILSSAERFFRKIGIILFVYVCILIIVYPFIVSNNYSYIYTVTLIIVISISSFAQYFFAIVDGLLLNADQRGYIQYVAATITVLVSTLVCCIEIQLGFSIHVVKLSGSLIYLIRPIVMRMYVTRHYEVVRNVKYKEEPIKQKWNGIAQHVSTVVLDGTDSIVLTLFSTLVNVSIYSVYNMITYGVKNLFFSITNGGIQSLLGEMWAKNEKDNLHATFSWMEWLIHNTATYLFTCTGILIIPFITIYTWGVNDANYIQPVFAALMVLANGVHCLRLPYHIMIKAAGKYKETQHSYYISTLMNIVLSIAFVKYYGIIGVAIGTVLSMSYQTVWMAWYNSKHLLHRNFRYFVGQSLFDVFCSATCIFACSSFSLKSISYGAWMFMAIKVSLISFTVFFLLNLLIYRKKTIRVVYAVSPLHKGGK